MDGPGQGIDRGGPFSDVATGVGRLAVGIVNVYAVDLPGGGWVLVDTGLPGLGWYVRWAVEGRYGVGARPLAIVLTHGHFDHAGNAAELAEGWGVAVVAHPLELPYLTGRSDYAPGDPTPGGAMCFFSRFFPRSGVDLGPRVRGFEPGGAIAEMPGWRWVHTPGHTPGHASLFRAEGAVLIAGDALATTDLDAWTSQPTWPRRISRPPTPFTPDWPSARASLRDLAGLDPSVIAAGHGLPIEGGDLGEALARFAQAMPEPERSRYAGQPPRYAPDGALESVPPPVDDPLPRTLAVGAALALGVALGASIAARRGRKGA